MFSVHQLSVRARIVLTILIGICSLPTANAQTRTVQERPNIWNPQISTGIVFLGGYSTADEHDHEGAHGLESGFQLQEIELRVESNVDPFFRGIVSLAGHMHEGVMEVGFEEAFLSTIAIPDLTLRAGKFLLNFGKSNLRHTHARHYLSAPMPTTALTGADHLLGIGVSLDYLMPLPFYTELNLQAVRPGWETGHSEDSDGHAHGGGGDPLDLTYVTHLKTLFDLGDTTTLELGGSYMANQDDHGHLQSVWGVDMTMKWVPLQRARYETIDWTTEYISSHRHGVQGDGLYTSIRRQTAQQWWMQLRGGVLGLTRETDTRRYRGETLLAFAPSERSAVRLQYALETQAHSDTTADEHHDLVHEVFLQFIVSMGTHPAHAY
ncbi:MAG: hypothetical protein CMH54_01995 [Myxococcales bacterium]|nr:hypothetical protein [Myxococcales bacterium]